MLKTRVLLTEQSGNQKTGPIPVSISTADTCPPSCVVRDACYAKYHHLSRHWKRTETDGVAWDAFCAKVAALPKGILWRHNEAGDLPGHGNLIDDAALRLLVAANRGRRGFTYSAKPVLGHGTTAHGNRAAIAEANAAGFIVNLSAVGLVDADAKAALGIAPVTVVLPHAVATETLETPAGRPVIVCPNHIDRRVQCWRCGICAERDRAQIIGFPAHGTAKAQITRLLSR